MQGVAATGASPSRSGSGSGCGRCCAALDRAAERWCFVSAKTLRPFLFHNAVFAMVNYGTYQIPDYRYNISCESFSQFDSLPLTSSLTQASASISASSQHLSVRLLSSCLHARARLRAQRARALCPPPELIDAALLLLYSRLALFPSFPPSVAFPLVA